MTALIAVFCASTRGTNVLNVTFLVCKDSLRHHSWKELEHAAQFSRRERVNYLARKSCFLPSLYKSVLFNLFALPFWCVGLLGGTAAIHLVTGLCF